MPDSKNNKSNHSIELQHLINVKGDHKYSKFSKYILEKVFSIQRLNAVFNQIIHEDDSRSLFHAYLKILEIKAEISVADLNKVPEKGPLVLVANHPFNGLDVIAIAAVLSEVREDIRILGNQLISNIPMINEWNIPLHFKGNPNKNAIALRKVVAWLKQGGVLIVFPAGEQLRIFRKKNQVYDGRWSDHTAGIIRLTQSTTVPVYLPGKISHPLHLFGTVNPRLRSYLMTREFLKPLSRVEVYVGKPIHWDKLADFPSDREITKYIQTKTYFLRNRSISVKKNQQNNKSGTELSIADAVNPEIIASEISQLPGDQRLCREKELSVHIFSAQQCPNLMQEIGRLREQTFRSVKEGTGKAIDLDKYDEYYHHIVLWNDSSLELIGAYRIGLSDEILDNFGVKGFYTYSLFKLKPTALKTLGTFIELGRSFIRLEYQKQYSMLLLLWKGIAQFIIRNPQYRYLFGPVSISNDYNAISKNMIYYFLKDKHSKENFSSKIKPRKPYQAKKIKVRQKRYLFERIKNIDDVSVLISEIEKDGKGVPVLLKHYLKLNAKLLSFNVDKDFSSVLDGLILVDLLETDERFLKRFTGQEGYRAFQAFHKNTLKTTQYSELE